MRHTKHNLRRKSRKGKRNKKKRYRDNVGQLKQKPFLNKRQIKINNHTSKS